MEILLKYRGREITKKEAEFIQNLIAEYPDYSRRKLSAKLCEVWDWRQPNGALKDQVCRSMMLELHRAGHITLPEVKCRPNNPMLKRKKPELKESVDATPLKCSLKDLPDISIREISRSKDEAFFNGLIEKYHYLSYTHPVGEHLKYIVYSGDRPIACLAWCSAVRHLGPRDRHIGWTQKDRVENLKLIAYNTRYLILPWVNVPHLASHLLGRFSKILPKDWLEKYGHPIAYLETFVYPEKYKGTCYKAANWKSLGLTTGRGKNAPTQEKRVPEKEILVYPLRKDFKRFMVS